MTCRPKSRGKGGRWEESKEKGRTKGRKVKRKRRRDKREGM
jgi:hypothetical protein